MDAELLSVVTNAIGYEIYSTGEEEDITLTGEQTDRAQLAAQKAYRHFLQWVSKNPGRFEVAMKETAAYID